MSSKPGIAVHCSSLFIISSVFAVTTLAASVETVGNLKVGGVIESTSGGFKFPDGTTWTTGSMDGLLFNVGFVVDDSDSNTGNLTSGAIKFGSNASGEGIASQRTSGTGQNGLDFYTGSTSRLFIGNNGYVGIGTRTPQFQLAEANSGNGLYTRAQFGHRMPLYLIEYNPAIGFNAYVNGQGGHIYGSSDYAGMLAFDWYTPGGFEFRTMPSGTAGNEGAMTTRLAITNDGKVGIGTITPAQALDVAGNIKSSGSGTFTGSMVVDNGNANNGAVNALALTFGQGSGEGIASKRTSGGNQYGLDFYSDYTRRMSISQTGRVAIGTDPNSGILLNVISDSSIGTTIYAVNNAASGAAIMGIASNGTAIYGSSSSGYAGLFGGNVTVSGTLSKSGGSFKIDHPLDPANKYLSHSFVESPDMKNIYDGVVTLDASGKAVVNLPEWFQALNRDFRYQLTAVGVPGPNLYIAQEVTDNSFKIAGGAPNGKVSWQVTGIRQDAWANAHRIPVEEDKTVAEAGKYLHPELFGQPETKSVYYNMKVKSMKK